MKQQVQNFSLNTTDSIKTMSSREIAELTGKEHKNVIRDIRTMLDDIQEDYPKLDDSILSHVKEDKDNRGYTSCFHLNKELSLTLVAGYNTKMRLAIIRRWQELEEQQGKNTLALPNFEDPAEAAIAWALQYKEKQLALQQLEVAKPKVEFVDKYVDRGNLRKITDVAKELGVSSRTLCKWLRDNDHMWKRTDKQLWKQAFIDKGYGEHKLTTVSSGKLETTTPLVTPVGDIFIKQNFNK